MKRKINIQLGLISLIAIVMTVTGITLVYYGLFQQQVWEDLKQSAQILVETGVFQDACSVRNGTAEGINLLDSGNFRITWIDADGTVLFDNDTDISRLPNHMDRPEIKLAFKNGKGESTRCSETMNMDTFYYALLLKNGTVLRVSMQARTITNLLITALPVIVGIAVFILLGCVLIGHFLAEGLMKPLEEMAENLDESSGVSIYKELEPFARKIRAQHENVLAAAKSRQDFTANISHELKTPITAISGYAELIENRLMDTESEIHIAKQIRHNADRLLSLITDIIRLSEFDHKELPRTFTKTDLFSVAQECVKDLRTLADKKMITLNCRGISASVNGDPALLREMIDNMVHNGIQYNEEHGTVQVNVSIKNGHPTLSIKDSGIGIPADQLDRVFERFYRADKSRSRETGGTGLGLAIVKHIAEIHSAEISMESAIGEGTEIIVRF